MKKRRKLSTVQPSGYKPTAFVPLSPDTRHSIIFLAVAVACLTFLVYLPGLGNGFLDWDDTQYIVQNPRIRSLNLEFFRWALFDYRFNLWHPLTWISHAVDYSVWGLNPFGHHLSNNILHALNTGIVVWLTGLLMRTARATSSEPDPVETEFLFIASGITALLFGLHPIHVESVAWVAERKDLLYALFFMLSTIAYLRYAQRQMSEGAQAWYRHRHYWLALGLFFLSLASKPMAVTLPAVLIILDWYPLRRTEQRRMLWQLLVEKIPFIALSAGVSLLTILAQKSAGGLKSLEHASFDIRIAIAFKSLADYLWNLVIPARLLPFYPYPKDASIGKPEYITAALIIIAITACCIKVARQKGIFLAAWCYFVVTVFPVLGFFQAGWQAKADRFMYLPSLGLFLLVGIGCAVVWRNSGSRDQHWALLKNVSRVGMAGVMIALAYLTFSQISIWKSTVTLWDYNLRSIAEIYPQAYYLRGGAFKDARQHDRAIEDFSRAISLAPEYTMAYIERAGVYLEKGMIDRAIDDAGRAIALNPDFVEAYVTRGNAFFITGDSDRAVRDYNAAIARKPDFAPAYIARGFVSKSRGDTGNAIEDYSRALAINPYLADIYMARGDVYLSTGSKDRAAADFRKACELGSNTACMKAQIPF